MYSMSSQRASQGMSLSRCRCGEGLDGVLGVVEPAALVVAERPHRRRRGPPGQPGVGLQDGRHVGAGEDVLGVLAAARTGSGTPRGRRTRTRRDTRCRRRMPDIAPGRIGLVVEERDGDVEGVELDARPVAARIVGGLAGGELRGLASGSARRCSTG